ncbi:glucuronate isomerase [Lentisphaerota bacterium WC36G]|nr:glucuronate isomerase [Lentisphaerae bacterium WC36]
MKPFINDDFVLSNDFAKKLYHDYAEKLPIIDYHCHLPPQEVAVDKKWDNIAQIWLNGDHYKWRAMRSNGIDEYFITGDASDREKFNKFAETMPYLYRNPIFHWAQLELARYFDIFDILSPSTADKIWEETSEKIKNMSARSLMKKSNVVLACTTDDPIDSLEHHIAVAEDTLFDIDFKPTWRPDKAMNAENLDFYNSYVDSLEAAAKTEINSFDSLIEALEIRHQHFHDVGCRLSDHGLDTFYMSEYSKSEVKTIFEKIRSKQEINHDQLVKFKSAMMIEFGRMDYEKNWVQQLHIGALRNNNSKMFAKLGADAGFDSIADERFARPLSMLLNTLNNSDNLPKTIIYNLNPRDNEMIATMIGNFQDGKVPGKMQYGSGWWFLDQKNGMERQIDALSQLGLLRRFVGMLTDSRSFLSYPRHEYFRRILCNVLGNDMSEGLLPNDIENIGAMVEDICYNNACNYFNLNN